MADRAWLALALLVACCVSGCDAPPDDGPPSFVLCMSDDQGWGDAGFRGHPDLVTPTLDAMAERGLRLERFYAASPNCSPTRGSVLTGRHPNRFGCFNFGHTLRPAEVTFAEVLREAGYATGHFGKWHLGPVDADSPIGPGASGFGEWLSSPNYFDLDPSMNHNGLTVQMTGEGSEVVVDAALEFIGAAAGRDQPFLAVVWFGSPHSPHHARLEDREPYANLPEAAQHYYGELTAMDRAMGRLRSGLRELGIQRSTLLWFTSDNGSKRKGSNGGLKGIKPSLYEGGIRVLSLLEWPSRIETSKSDLPTGTVDIFPTLLDLAGAAPPDPGRPLDGQSLAPLLAGRPSSRAAPLGFWQVPTPGILIDREGNHGALPPPPDLEGCPGHAAWIDGSYKLHRRAVEEGATFHYELYDLARDPGETTDLADGQAQRVTRMRADLQAWQDSVLASLQRADG